MKEWIYGWMDCFAMNFDFGCGALNMKWIRILEVEANAVCTANLRALRRRFYGYLLCAF